MNRMRIVARTDRRASITRTRQDHINSIESSLWRVRPSQILNIWVYLRCFVISMIILIFNYFVYNRIGVVFLLSYLTIFLLIIRSIWAFLLVRSSLYELTTQRLRIKRGVFTQAIEEVELYRIQNHLTSYPWYFRPFNLGNLILETSDTIEMSENLTSSVDLEKKKIYIEAIKFCERRRQDIRENSEICRQNRNNFIEANMR